MSVKHAPGLILTDFALKPPGVASTGSGIPHANHLGCFDTISLLQQHSLECAARTVTQLHYATDRHLTYETELDLSGLGSGMLGQMLGSNRSCNDCDGVSFGRLAGA